MFYYGLLYCGCGQNLLLSCAVAFNHAEKRQSVVMACKRGKSLFILSLPYQLVLTAPLLPFDETSPQMVKALLEAISVYAAQGIKALEQKTKSLLAARLLLLQIRDSGS